MFASGVAGGEQERAVEEGSAGVRIKKQERRVAETLRSLKTIRVCFRVLFLSVMLFGSLRSYSTSEFGNVFGCAPTGSLFDGNFVTGCRIYSRRDSDLTILYGLRGNFDGIHFLIVDH
ncbi:hypothetical protein GWI33_007973 [Rhynchophorus ferrugineus]|uniref:Uncharacterized protein n=1 Tax=Rhynchophorus ferrugineus TaxID=354439 RepID=A0A834IHH3_RHYFE|nr:hypothetical protein GWI33_007973 [Rhynchophorus ferrugineus]